MRYLWFPRLGKGRNQALAALFTDFGIFSLSSGTWAVCYHVVATLNRGTKGKSGQREGTSRYVCTFPTGGRLCELNSACLVFYQAHGGAKAAASWRKMWFLIITRRRHQCRCKKWLSNAAKMRTHEEQQMPFTRDTPAASKEKSNSQKPLIYPCTIFISFYVLSGDLLRYPFLFLFLFPCCSLRILKSLNATSPFHRRPSTTPAQHSYSQVHSNPHFIQPNICTSHFLMSKPPVQTAAQTSKTSAGPPQSAHPHSQ